MFYTLQCVRCHSTQPPQSDVMTCPRCGLEGTLDVLYDWEQIRRSVSQDSLIIPLYANITRYMHLLPVGFSENAHHFPVGWTPLIPAPRLAQTMNLRTLWIKNESHNPSASLKDRASLVALAHARQQQRTPVACASTGNAASSLATLASAEGMEAVILIPASAPRPKLAQLLMHGARLFPVDGTYDDAFDLCQQACQEFGWYNRSTAINPYCAEGKKTCALEIWEQLNGTTPDRILVSVGDGCILAGIFKGFRDLLELGWIEKLPKLYGVQAAGSCVVAQGYETGTLEPRKPSTYADSIAVGTPRDYLKAWRAIEQAGGKFLIVTDEEIQSAARQMARLAGIFGEPSGVACLAGLHKLIACEPLPPEENIVLIMTGSGLKDTEGALLSCETPPKPIPPTLKALKDRFQG